MVMSQFEKELIVKSVGAERQREAAEAFRRKQVLSPQPAKGRHSVWRSVRLSFGVMLMRTGARVAGLNPRLVLESR